MIETRQIQIDKVRPNLRLIFSEETIDGLVCDIRANGMKEPISAELFEYSFIIIDGEKRWRACKRCGFHVISVVLDVD